MYYMLSLGLAFRLRAESRLLPSFSHLCSVILHRSDGIPLLLKKNNDEIEITDSISGLWLRSNFFCSVV